jgi:transposase
LSAERRFLVEETNERPELVERVAALDLGKATLTACVRVPGKAGRRCQEVREFGTTTVALRSLARYLASHGVGLVAMEATSDYWKPVFYLLEAEGFTCWLLNARHVRNVPGRPKTDKPGAVWLAKVAGRGMCSPSLVHSRDVRRLRDLTRYRRTLIRERTAEKQRAGKLLEDAQIKLSSVVSDIFGASGRKMLEAMIAGQHDPRALAQLAIGRMRAKLTILEEALTGHFSDHHAFICQMMLDQIDDLTRRAADLTARIQEQIAPFAAAAARLDEIPGVGATAAQELIAEIGPDMTRFPDAAHLVSWAKFAPMDKAPAGKKRTATTGKGNPWPGATIGEIVTAAARTDTFLAERYQRIARHRGKRRAIVAVGNSVLTIIWHLLSDPEARYHDLGPGYYETRVNNQRRQRNLIRQLEKLTGQTVTIQPAA